MPEGLNLPFKISSNSIISFLSSAAGKLCKLSEEKFM